MRIPPMGVYTERLKRYTRIQYKMGCAMSMEAEYSLNAKLDNIVRHLQVNQKLIADAVKEGVISVVKARELAASLPQIADISPGQIHLVEDKAEQAEEKAEEKVEEKAEEKVEEQVEEKEAEAEEMDEEEAEAEAEEVDEEILDEEQEEEVVYEDDGDVEDAEELDDEKIYSSEGTQPTVTFYKNTWKW
jgi:preprotein translocase subunit SecD